jgi:WD40 repeat protein
MPVPTARTFPTLTPHPSETPSPTFTPSPTQTPTPTPAAAAGFETPIPSPLQVISPQNASDLRLLARFGNGIAQQLAVSTKRHLLGAAASHGVYLYNVNTLQEIFSFYTGEFHRCLAFSPGGRFLASGTTDGNLYVWNMEGESLQYIFQVRGEPFLSLAFSPDSAVLSASSMDRHIYLWDLDDGELLNTFKSIQDPIQSLSFSPDGALLYAWTFKESIQVWRVSDGKSLPDIYIGKDNQGKYPTLGIFSTDGSLFAAASDFRVRIFTTSNGRTLRLINDIQQPVIELALSSDGHYLAIESGPQVKIWNVEIGDLVATIELPPALPFHLLAFSPGTGTLLTMGNALLAWDFATRESAAAVIDHPSRSGLNEYVASFALASSASLDGRYLYVLSLDASLITYDLYQDDVLSTDRLEQETVSAAAFAYSAPLVAMGNLNGEVGIWDVSNGSLEQMLMGQ